MKETATLIKERNQNQQVNSVSSEQGLESTCTATDRVIDAVVFCNPGAGSSGALQPSPAIVKFVPPSLPMKTFDANNCELDVGDKENHENVFQELRFDALNLSTDSSDSEVGLLNPYSPAKVKAVAAAHRYTSGFVRWNNHRPKILWKSNHQTIEQPKSGRQSCIPVKRNEATHSLKKLNKKPPLPR